MRNVEVTLVNDDGEEIKVVVASNNIQSAIPSAVRVASHTSRKSGWRYLSARFIGASAPTPLHEIERKVMSGRHVSSSEMNRFIRSPRGMMMVASMRGHH